jgi:hypothetical protein
MLFLVLAPVACGVLAGYSAGGRLRRLVTAKIRAVWLLWFAAGLQFVHFRLTDLRGEIESRTGTSLMVPIFGLVGAWAIVNLPARSRIARAAAIVVLVGGAMNAVVIAVNGRMPYSPAAATALSDSAEQRSKPGESPKHEPATSATRLAWLGDVIPVPPVQAVISAGDIVLLVGGAGLIAIAMGGPGPLGE